MKNKECLVFFIMIYLVACQSKNAETRQIIQEWQYKEIKIPDEIHYKVLGRDTMCAYFSDKPYKVLMYIDSIDCIGCQFDLYKWKRFIESCDDSIVNFVFVICSADYKFLEQALEDFQFNFPIIYDYNDDFNKLNHFPSVPYRTFLLDKDNKVVVIGNPVYNLSVKDLYLKRIMQSSRKSSDLLINQEERQ